MGDAVKSKQRGGFFQRRFSRKGASGRKNSLTSEKSNESELNNERIMDTLLERSDIYSNKELNSALQRTQQRLNRQAEKNFESMKRSLELAASEYTNNNKSNKENDDEDGDGDDDDFKREVRESEMLDFNEGAESELQMRTKPAESNLNNTSFGDNFNPSEFASKTEDDDDILDDEEEFAEMKPEITKSEIEDEEIQEAKVRTSVKRVKSKPTIKFGISKKSTGLDNSSVLKMKKELDSIAGSTLKSKSRYIPKSMLSPPKSEKSAPMLTNLDMTAWSVCSYDSCGGDVRRNYNIFIMNNRKQKFKKKLKNKLAYFLGANDQVYEIPKRKDSGWEDHQPFGPSDPHDAYYQDLISHKKSNLISATLSRMSGKTSQRRRDNSGTEKRRKSTIVPLKKISNVLTLANFFTKSSRDNRKNTAISEEELSEIENINFEEERQKMLDARKKAKEDELRQKQLKQKQDEMNMEQFNDAVIPEEENEKPTYIPPDMQWDPNFDNGKGGLVNRVAKHIPSGKMWSKSANGGRGGIVNKPPPAGAMPPGKIWSRTAQNGQGGVVNLPPHKNKVPRGYVWDYDAEDGMGALVKKTKSKKSKEKELEKKEAELKKRETELKNRETLLIKRESINQLREDQANGKLMPSPEEILGGKSASNRLSKIELDISDDEAENDNASMVIREDAKIVEETVKLQKEENLSKPDTVEAIEGKQELKVEPEGKESQEKPENHGMESDAKVVHVIEDETETPPDVDLNRKSMKRVESDSKASKRKTSGQFKLGTPTGISKLKASDVLNMRDGDGFAELVPGQAKRNSKLLTLRRKKRKGTTLRKSELGNMMSPRSSIIMQETGIAEGHVQKLFERFESLSRSASMDEEDPENFSY